MAHAREAYAQGVLIYITGVSGTGKSAVCAELVARGYDARDADYGIGGWFRIADGVEVPPPSVENYRTPQWYAVHQWGYSLSRTAEFASEVRDGIGFLCGSGANESEIWSLIDKAFYLDVDEATLRQRLTVRTANTFGKTDYERQNILEWHSNMAANARRFGIRRLDSTRPIGEIVDDLLCRCGLPAVRDSS